MNFAAFIYHPILGGWLYREECLNGKTLFSFRLKRYPKVNVRFSTFGISGNTYIHPPPAVGTPLSKLVNPMIILGLSQIIDLNQTNS